MFKKSLKGMRRRLAAMVRSAQVLRNAAGLAILLLLGACRTMPPLPPVNLSEPGWMVRQGQAVWHSGKAGQEITGELLVATHTDGRALVEFTKPPVTIVTARNTGSSWEARLGPDNRVYAGKGTPPARLFWLHLPRCLAGGAPPDSWSWQKLAGGSWRLENKATSEFVEGYLNP